MMSAMPPNPNPNPPCLRTLASSASVNAYANPITRGAGGRWVLGPVVHATPEGSGSPSGVAFATSRGRAHHALITARWSHADERHRHAAPAIASDEGGTRPHQPSSTFGSARPSESFSSAERFFSETTSFSETSFSEASSEAPSSDEDFAADASDFAADALLAFT